MHTDWEPTDTALVKNFEFKDFTEAINFINCVAQIAQRLNHHPEITNAYNRVTLRLSTHDAGMRVTKKDYELASEIDALTDLALT
jgi:4a-hydroxytetrahydrobiopterin dehydratase